MKVKEAVQKVILVLGLGETKVEIQLHCQFGHFDKLNDLCFAPISIFQTASFKYT